MKGDLTNISTAIAVSGKGGTGKTTLSGLLIVSLVKTGKTPVLAIDADPNATLNETLGVTSDKSIGNLREEVRENIEAIPAGMPKETFLEYRMQDAIIEEKGFDVLAMGRPEGPGCYCYVNSVLRKYMDQISGNYPYVVMDNEAGMEHLARQTTRKADHLLITSDPSMRGIETAARLRDLAQEERLHIGHTYLVVNNIATAQEELNEAIQEKIKERDLELVGIIPHDELITRFDLEKKPFFDLPEESPALQAARRILGKITGGEDG